MTDYSIVVPVFNSEFTLRKLYDRTVEVFKKLNKSVQFVFVDDSSLDNSWEVLKSIKAVNPKNVVIIRLNKNYGQQNATFCGMEHATGRFIITMDDDLQQPPEEIPLLINKMEEEKCDLVYGVYKKKQHSFLRNLGSKVVKKTGGRLLDRPDIVSSFRLVRAEIAKKIFPHGNNVIFVDELLWWYTNSLTYAWVEHHKRVGSKSGYSYGKLWRFLAEIILYYTNFPLKFMVYGGLFSSVLFLAITFYYLGAKLFFDVPLGYTSIIVGIMLSTSLILFSLGVIGEYISRLYQSQNKKPPYIIKEIEKNEN
jgi:glycosyltransferase involved in cell wall biosynthesis